MNEMYSYKCLCGAAWMSEVPPTPDNNSTMDAHLSECPVFKDAQEKLKNKSDCGCKPPTLEFDGENGFTERRIMCVFHANKYRLALAQPSSPLPDNTTDI